MQQALRENLLEFSKGYVGIPEGVSKIYDANQTITCANGSMNNSGNSIPMIQAHGSANHSPIISRAAPLSPNISANHHDVYPTDENSKIIISLLPQSLKSLQVDMLKPFEQVVQARIRQLAADTKLSFKKKHWNFVLSLAAQRGFTIIETPLGRLIYSSHSIFYGVDPRHPQSRFEWYVWEALQVFLTSIHPMCYPLRYQFATFLKNEGPIQLKTLPLGILSELVESAISRGLLKRLDAKTIATVEYFDRRLCTDNQIDLLSVPMNKLKDDPVTLLLTIIKQFLPLWPLPVFVVVDCTGPPHSPTFSVVSVLLEFMLAEGSGTSKIEGQVNAAFNTLNSYFFYELLQSALSSSKYLQLVNFIEETGIQLSVVCSLSSSFSSPVPLLLLCSLSSFSPVPFPSCITVLLLPPPFFISLSPPPPFLFLSLPPLIFLSFSTLRLFLPFPSPLSLKKR